MTLLFNDIPAALRIPGWYIEFDNSLAGNAAVNFKVILVGQRLAAGTILADVPTLISDSDIGDIYFGRGSILAAMCRIAKITKPFLELWAVALDDDGAGVVADGTVTIAGPATKAGTLHGMIAGYSVDVAVASADSADDMATAFAAAIVADTELPVLAVVDGVTTNQVNITAKNKGEFGNDIDIRFNYFETSQSYPDGVSTVVVDMANGTTNPDITGALASMGDVWYNWMAIPYTDAPNLIALAAELEGRYGPTRQIGSRAFAPYRGDLSATGTFGNGNNSPHITNMGTNIVPEPPYLWAAVNAMVAGDALAIDPARPLQTLSLPGLKPPVSVVRWDDTERNSLLFDGIATYTVDTAGLVHIERQITQYQLNAAGFSDESYLDINTPETLERIRFAQRSTFAQKYPRHKLAEDSEEVAAGQPVMTPSVAKTELLGLYETFLLSGLAWCQDYDSYAESLVVEIGDGQGGGDRTVLAVQDSPKLVSQYRVHKQQTQFRR